MYRVFPVKHLFCFWKSNWLSMASLTDLPCPPEHKERGRLNPLDKQRLTNGSQFLPKQPSPHGCLLSPHGRLFPFSPTRQAWGWQDIEASVFCCP